MMAQASSASTEDEPEWGEGEKRETKVRDELKKRGVPPPPDPDWWLLRMPTIIYSIFLFF